MAKKESREVLLKLSNFTIYGVRDAFGHQTMMEICTASKNWMLRFDESTFMFGIIKSIVCMAPDKVETKQWIGYLDALINMEYQMGTCGVAVEVLVEISKIMLDYSDKLAKKLAKHSEEEDKAAIDDMSKEQEMKEELKKIDDDK